MEKTWIEPDDNRKKVKTKYSKKQLIDALRKKAAEMNTDVLMAKDVKKDKSMPSMISYISHFKSFSKALKAAGLKPSRETKKGVIESRNKKRRKELLEQYYRKYEELGRFPTGHEVDEDPNMASRATYNRLFGSFENVIKIIEPDAKPISLRRWRTKGVEYSSEYLLKLLKDTSKALKRPPRVKDFRKDPNLPSPEIYYHYWSGWNEALKAAGITPKPCQRRGESALSSKKASRRTVRKERHSWDTESIVEAIYRKTQVLGRFPTTREIEYDLSMPSTATIYRKIGSLSKLKNIILKKRSESGYVNK